LQAVRDNAPDDDLCTCGLREAFLATRSASPVDREDELDRIAALSDAATPGPWEGDSRGPAGAEDASDIRADVRGATSAFRHIAILVDENHPADAAFIVAAVNYVRSRLAARSKDPSDAR
jgi:hypothetical protein